MQFLKLSTDLITDTNITSNEFRIYTYLLSRYNEEKDCAYPSIEVISERVGISERTVSTSIKNLVKLGYMRIEKKSGVNGNFNTYKKFKYLINGIVKVTKKVVKTATEKAKEVIRDKKPLIVSDCKERGIQMEIEEITPFTQEHQQKISLILKQGIKLTEKQMWLIGDMDLETLREAIRLFKKKNGRKFALLINLYLDAAEKNLIDISKDIERYLCGSYIRISQEEKETQEALIELELYGVPYSA